MTDWKTQLRERLTATANTAGVWGYCANSAGNAEPTALATLALQAALTDNPTDEQRSTWAAAANRGGQWLAQHQAGDGGLSAMPDTTGACWPTPLALLAWTFPPEPGAFAPNAQRATQWLLATRGRALPRNPEIHDHDTMLVGWPWVTDCHSWVEPTAYAIIALRHTGHADNPRVREGVRLLIDRALPDGGWNYGNRRVLEHVLRPFPATTGTALTALAGEARTDDIEQSIDYAHREAQRIRAPQSLAWLVIGLRACNAAPPDTNEALAESAARLLNSQPAPHYEALLLLAAAKLCPFIPSADSRATETANAG